MGISAHIARLRAAVGHDLLLLPSVSVLPVDAAGRLLLVRYAGHHDGWAVLGGAVEVGGSPVQAAVRETREEIGVEVRYRARSGPGARISAALTDPRTTARPAIWA